MNRLLFMHGAVAVIIPDEDVFIWEAYNNRCVICRTWAACLHECPPKSLNPHWKEHPESRYPVCNRHHEELHRMSVEEQKRLLDESRKRNFPLAERKVLEHEC